MELYKVSPALLLLTSEYLYAKVYYRNLLLNPAINAIGYWDKNGKFYEVDDKKSPYYELIHQYNLLEYNNLFGKDDQQKEFFYIKINVFYAAAIFAFMNFVW